jgi:DNA-binding GntR family transcriptional regulator
MAGAAGRPGPKSAAKRKPAGRAAARKRGAGQESGERMAPSVTQSEQAYQIIEEMITTLKLPPGATMTEGWLAETTQFGRTPVREALLRLAEDGLVRIVPHRGLVVTDVNVRDQLLLLEVRRELERLIAGRAARRSTPEQRQRFAELAEAMRTATATNDYLLFLRSDNEFNRFVAACSANPFAIKAIASIHAMSRRYWSVFAKPQDISIAAPLHAKVMDAIVAGDEAAAEKASDALMDYVEAFTKATVNV